MKVWKKKKEEDTGKRIQPVPPKTAGFSASKADVKDKPAVTESSSPAEKKKINPKYFDTVRGPLCFECKEWEHKCKECPTKVCSMAGCSNIVDGAPRWNELRGFVDTNECNITLDSAADVSVAAKDLVPEATYTGDYKTIAGVHAVERRVPVAKILVAIEGRKFWLRAAVVPGDLLLGADCDQQVDLLEEALTALKQQQEVVNAVTTRHQAILERTEQARDQAADAEPVTEFDLDETLYVRNDRSDRKKLTRREKRLDRIQAFANSSRDLEEESSLDRPGLVKEQQEDNSLQTLSVYAEDTENSHYTMIDGLLYHVVHDEEGGTSQQLVVPMKRRERLVRLAHGSPLAAHLGCKRTTKKLQRSFFWPGMSKDVREMVQRCMECQKVNLAREGKAPLVSLPVISTPFDRIAIDVVGPLPITDRKNRYILTVMDFATRYPEAFPLRRIDTESVLEALMHFFSHFGLPKEILSDRGTNFTATLMKEVAKRLGISHIKASPYHPQTNGMSSGGTGH